MLLTGMDCAYSLVQYEKDEKGKPYESRGRKVTDLTGTCPTMAGLPDDNTIRSHICNRISSNKLWSLSMQFRPFNFKEELKNEY